jgi:L-asparaginase
MKRILILQTGGTILMRPSADAPDEVAPDPRASRWLLKEIPDLARIADIEQKALLNLDSSDISPSHWTLLAETILAEKDAYDGFVVLHGTDTMAYTASAMSFALAGLGKPVIFTGSQVPLANLRSDARRNLINAVEVATLDLPEVAICFNDAVFRGNRATKMSIGDFDAFGSPNMAPLAEIGIEIRVSLAHGRAHVDPQDLVDLHAQPQNLAALPKFSTSVHILKIHPAISPALLAPLATSGIQALILEAFGSGNFPISGEHNLLPFFKACRDAGMHLIIASQAPYDAVHLTKYESGRAAAALGMISAGDMTLEAALTKTMFLLAHPDRFPDFPTAFHTPLCGERS